MNKTSFSPLPLHLTLIYFHQFYSSSLVTWLRVSQSCYILGFDLLEIVSSSFFRVLIDLPISEKPSKIKFLEKFQKNLYKCLCQKWSREAPGRDQEGLPRHHTHRGRGLALAAPTCCEGALAGPSLISSSPAHTLSQNISTPYSNPCSCYSSSRFFDLLAQPIISAEIWSICSLVCDSSACPSRISFGEVFLEYFSIVDGWINEYACLFFCLEMLIWCMLVL
jgi:hypothetical protein